MVCNGCCFYHPYRDRTCSAIPRMSAEDVKRMQKCDCRLTIPDVAMEMRKVTEEERRRRWHKETDTEKEEGNDQDNTGQG